MYEMAQTMANDTTSDTKIFLQQNINIGLHFIEDTLGSFYTDTIATLSTVASTSTYETPARFVRFREVYVTVSSIRYPLEEIHDERMWQRIMSRTSGQTSSIPEFIFSRKDQFEIYPTPSGVNTITMVYEASNKDLSVDDYATGTITTLTNGNDDVMGSSTAWVTGGVIAGRYFKINADGVWYKIETVTDATNIVLYKNYEGTSIAAGSSNYTIGEIPNIPPSIHNLPVFYALSQYYGGPKVDMDKSADYMDKFLGREKYIGTGLEAAKARWGKRYTSGVIRGARSLRKGIGLFNKNWQPRVIT